MGRPNARCICSSLSPAAPKEGSDQPAVHSVSAWLEVSDMHWLSRAMAVIQYVLFCGKIHCDHTWHHWHISFYCYSDMLRVFPSVTEWPWWTVVMVSSVTDVCSICVCVCVCRCVSVFQCVIVCTVCVPQCVCVCHSVCVCPRSNSTTDRVFRF